MHCLQFSILFLNKILYLIVLICYDLRSTGIQQRNGLKKTLDPLKNVKPLSIFDSSLTNYFNKEDDLFLVKSP